MSSSDINLNRACFYSFIRFSDGVITSLTNTQKKVIIVASCLFGMLAICYAIHKIWSNPHLTKVVKANEPLKQEQPIDDQIQEQLPSISPTVLPSLRESEIDSPRQDSETTESNEQEADVELPVDEAIIHTQDDDLLPALINDHPDVSLIDHGLTHFDDLLEYLQKYGSQLHCLNLEGLVIDDDLFSEIIQLCPSLKCLVISSVRITDAALVNLRGLKLTTANFFGCSYLTDQAIAHLQGMPLTSIDFSYCINLTDAAFVHLYGMPLESVRFPACQYLTDGAIAYLQGMPLTSINFAGCKKLSDSALAYLQGMQLTSVNFMVCNQLTDAGLGYLQGMPLVSIDFRGCNKISNTALSGLSV